MHDQFIGISCPFSGSSTAKPHNRERACCTSDRRPPTVGVTSFTAISGPVHPTTFTSAEDIAKAIDQIHWTSEANGGNDMHSILVKTRRAACVLASLLVTMPLLPSVALACEGAGEEKPVISISPASQYNFGTLIHKNETATRTFTYTNEGPGGWRPDAWGFMEGALRIMKVIGNSSCEKAVFNDTEIAVGGSCTLRVEFAPEAVGNYTLEVVVGGAPGLKTEGIGS